MKNLIATIAVEGIQLRAFHGVYEREKEEGNDFIVDVYLTADISRSAHTDQLEDTLDYQKVYEIVREEMKTPVNLLEHLAYRIAQQISALFPDILDLRIKMTKLNPMGMENCQRTYVDLLFDNTDRKSM